MGFTVDFDSDIKQYVEYDSSVVVPLKGGISIVIAAMRLLINDYPPREQH